MKEKEYEQVVNITKINDDTQYWFFRAGTGARYLTDFYINNYIGIANDGFTLKYLKKIKAEVIENNKNIKENIYNKQKEMLKNAIIEKNKKVLIKHDISDKEIEFLLELNDSEIDSEVNKILQNKKIKNKIQVQYQELINLELEQKYKSIFFNKMKKIKEDDKKLIYKDEKEKQSLTDEEMTSIKRSSSIQAVKSLDFINNMKVGDILLIPEKRTNGFHIGYIDSDIFEDTIEHREIGSEYITSDFNKKRKIHWIKRIDLKDLPDKLYWIKTAHKAIFNIDENAKSINTIISNLYLYKGEIHSILNIKTNDSITSDEWLEFQQAIKSITKEDNKYINQKQKVQSPGIIELFTNWNYSLPLITSSIILTSLVAGKINGIKIGKAKFNVKLTGLLRKEGLLGHVIYKENRLKTQIKNTKLENELESIKNKKGNQEEKNITVEDKIKTLSKNEKDSVENISHKMNITSDGIGNKYSEKNQKDN
ncbi:hypothetical protein [Apilactobacillus quenuiae]|uniref:hypothetical protein n=1 Tax=Apilactobacillus quenuiae TaxID=2008377 RepID=UPI000D01912C|nr:hypothetical protein [Apilactobacillus quenuiae]